MPEILILLDDRHEYKKQQSWKAKDGSIHRAPKILNWQHDQRREDLSVQIALQGIINFVGLSLSTVFINAFTEAYVTIICLM